MTQWISESEAAPERVQQDDPFKTPKDFEMLHAMIGATAPSPIDSLTEYLMAQEHETRIDALREYAGQVSPALDVDMLLTAACAAALAKYPQLETWRKVRKITYQSWQTQYWLRSAMVAETQRNSYAANAYVGLAVMLFEQLEDNCLASESERRNTQRADAWGYWKSSTKQLEDLWWGLRGSDFMNYEDEMRFFGLLYDLAPNEFHRLVAQSSNPYLVDAALQDARVTGYKSRFAKWRAVVHIAPPAFEQDGRWTGAVLLPLLLVAAKAELLAPVQQLPRVDPAPDQVAALTNEIEQLADTVVTALAARSDAMPMFVRWANWLMQIWLGQGDSEFDDARAPSFVDMALLKAIGKTFTGKTLPVQLPRDAAPWEKWCYRCVRASWAHDGHMTPPSFDEFADQWQITPDNWHGPEGRALLEYASPHQSSRNNIPDLLAHLLAVPLASSIDYATRWRQLWGNACYLREALEFGGAAAGAEPYADQLDASRLLLQLAGLGLACFDQMAGRHVAAPGAPEEIVVLHAALSSAAMEVLHIDDTINRDRWKIYLHQLAVRRAFWDRAFRKELEFPLFSSQQEPTVLDFMDFLQAEPNDLLLFLHACMQNQLDASALSDALRHAAIDLDAAMDTLRRLHEFRAHRYPMSGVALRAITPLLRVGKPRARPLPKTEE